MDEQLGDHKLPFCHRQGVHEIALIRIEITVKTDGDIDGHAEGDAEQGDIVEHKNDYGNIGIAVLAQDAVLHGIHGKHTEYCDENRKEIDNGAYFP